MRKGGGGPPQVEIKGDYGQAHDIQGFLSPLKREGGEGYSTGDEGSLLATGSKTGARTKSGIGGTPTTGSVCNVAPLAARITKVTRYKVSGRGHWNKKRKGRNAGLGQGSRLKSGLHRGIGVTFKKSGKKGGRKAIGNKINNRLRRVTPARFKREFKSLQ